MGYGNKRKSHEHRKKDSSDLAVGLTETRKALLDEFCSNLGLHFTDYELLDQAFYHRSVSNENPSRGIYNNERLEFLGDSVLGLATAAFLYSDMKENQEGDLAKIKANVVSEESLAPVAKNLMHLDKYLVLGRGEELSGGRGKKALLADAVEAVIGALYLDSGYEVAEKFVLSFIIPAVRNVQTNGNKNYKSALQEFYQKNHKDFPVYNLVKRSGPEHDSTFWVTVQLGDSIYGPEKGKSKKEAEQLVAKKACEMLGVK